eukprot:CAMPEP_0119120330 /NCGR_PEP_ID=MMETSP1310-20130426/1415_1 /TAXON_ID=464262 /ORGANISM="Genus nov. species nov., Strain RCC2339" /LENGTH=54 /DNA_ID=CAMNT_0007109801 /DNA_START=435 /DNA_END=596 /DNA_ORIENTATION=+
MPTIPFKGVLTSWETLAISWARAWAESSASCVEVRKAATSFSITRTLARTAAID